MHISIKRVYEEPAITDGTRILIDRLWPRGLTKEKAKIDLWLKAIAPSTELREWFGHDPAKWPEFRKRYDKELEANFSALAELRKVTAGRPTTLLYAAKDEVHNNAVALQNFLGR